MNTGKAIKPIIHIFKETNIGKYATVRHYELVEVKNGTNQIANNITIANDRGFAKSNPDYWLKIKASNKFIIVTGLFKTEKQSVFKGDINRRQSLVIAVFDNLNLSIYYFNNYYTNNIQRILQLL